ncbi:MAG: RluA family pseudouridine synthase [Syntrophobacterales bacterium]|nr:RluA family pseudouridine synthase [Syntrophobacterales bacterium]
MAGAGQVADGPPESLSLVVSPEEAGLRLDQFLARRTAYSRSRLARWLKAGQVRVNGAVREASYRVRAKEEVALVVPPPEPTELVPEPRPLDILFEDAHLLVVNKPPGLVVHPGAGHRGGTLLNALLAHCPELAGVGDISRPGLVHRLDKDTSGLLVVAKSAAAHAHLVRQFQARTVEKTYLALAWGRFREPQGEMVGEIGRHPSQRQKMSARPRRGKEAVTTWRVVEELPGGLTLVELSPKTGRTHQLRVHLAARGHPVVGDATYGGGAARFQGLPRLAGVRKLVSRQLLHAWRLSFTHPQSGARLTFEAPLPEDFQAVISRLEHLEERD